MMELHPIILRPICIHKYISSSFLLFIIDGSAQRLSVPFLSFYLGGKKKKIDWKMKLICLKSMFWFLC
jgi:hypothetical protein